MHTSFALLPGMHGDSGLFRRFRAELSVDAPVKAFAYPHRCESYELLAERVVSQLPRGRVVVIAESYSGPVGILVAAKAPERVRALVLTATFARSPLPLWTRPLTTLMRVPVSGLAVRSALVGPLAERGLVHWVKREIREVPAAVLEARARQILETDVEDVLAGLDCPVLYLHATRDLLLWQTKARILNARPETEVIDIDAAHLVLQAAPVEAAAAIQAWLSSAKS